VPIPIFPSITEPPDLTTSESLDDFFVPVEDLKSKMKDQSLDENVAPSHGKSQISCCSPFGHLISAESPAGDSAMPVARKPRNSVPDHSSIDLRLPVKAETTSRRSQGVVPATSVSGSSEPIFTAPEPTDSDFASPFRFPEPQNAKKRRPSSNNTPVSSKPFESGHFAVSPMETNVMSQPKPDTQTSADVTAGAESPTTHPFTLGGCFTTPPGFSAVFEKGSHAFNISARDNELVLSSSPSPKESISKQPGRARPKTLAAALVVADSSESSDDE
jgi:hypothetical protein